jgi:inner membrane protein
MDPLTHAISGAVLARAAPRQRLPRGTVLYLAFLAMLPDADYVLRFISDIVYLKYHRGITHSILLLPLWTWLCLSIVPSQRRRYPAMPWLIAAVLGLHIFLDIITSYGTMALSPLTDQRLTLDLVFIIDPLFTLTLLIPLLMSLLWPDHARKLCVFGLAGMAAYLGVAYSTQQQVLRLAEREMPRAEKYSALPLPFSPFRWQLIATYPDHYRRAAVDFQPDFPGSALFLPQSLTQRLSQGVRPADRPEWQQFPAMTSVQGIDGLSGVDFYRWFARFPVLLKRNGEFLEFADLRFHAGDPANLHFRLRISVGGQPQAWLIWSERQKSPVGMEKGLSGGW